MKWKTRDIEEYRRNLNGTTRQKTAFLWFPKEISHDVRWLEVATWEEEYYTWRGTLSYVLYGEWVATRWVDES